ncbi:tripartite tricarboxylate transporter substrate binding protein [Cupriavidus basilensis]|uniref:Tripartite tricarboxylate transporter substrate binding protein n=1 Tax=Cupriavidus basilensis TaxID=68895 RepID=A0ABT6AYE5_9BURK|nr:tripartite tricarboxylate transporter substrate binding protein [Cupriavidus basilensis]MDF3836711.1 tripartite tricarboxylate transporter substrate binding protein [Cupriavidus basilensis]
MTPINRAVCALTLLTAANFGGTSIAIASGPCPARFIKMIVPNPAGGVGDLISRVVAEKASAELGQPVVVENRSGATTVIGTDFVAKSKPDGCTILSLTASGVVVSVLRENLPYKLEHDFAPIIGVGSLPMALAVPVASKLNSFADLGAAAKSKDGITYGSGGTGSLAHLSAVRLIKELHGTGNHIPYRGNSDAIQGLLGNQIQLFFPSTAEALPFAKSGKLRLLGVTSDERLPALPDVPTMKELGFAGFSPRLWFALLAPVDTPPNIVSRLRDGFAKAVIDPSVQERLRAYGFTTEIQNPPAVSAFMKNEAGRWSKLIKEENIKITD